MCNEEVGENFFGKSVNSNIKMSFSDTLGKCQNK